jgi:O-antigen ligase
VPATAVGSAAVASLAGLALLTALSASWAALQGPAFDDRIRLAGYVAVLLLAASAWPSRRALRLVEPALAAGALVVIGYGLAGRLLPGVVELERSFGAGDLLEQPITYWNATGAVAAIGVVLCARLAGDSDRDRLYAVAAVAASAPLGAGLYLTGSRGAAAALAVGLAVLWGLDPRRRQLVGGACALAAAAIGAVVVGLLPGVRSPGDDPDAAQGVVALALLIVAAVGAGATRALLPARLVGMGGPSRRTRGRAGLAVAALVAAGAVAIAAVGGAASPGAADSARGSRADYWRVAVDSFAEQPLSGVGSGSFAVEWARERAIDESVRDAHSLYLETAAELGLLGLALLGAFLVSVAVAARRAHRADPSLAAGLAGALVVVAVHAGVDWDWEVPAVALIGLVLAGALLAGAGPRRADR